MSADSVSALSGVCHHPQCSLCSAVYVSKQRPQQYPKPPDWNLCAWPHRASIGIAAQSRPARHSERGCAFVPVSQAYCSCQSERPLNRALCRATASRSAVVIARLRRARQPFGASSSRLRPHRPHRLARLAARRFPAASNFAEREVPCASDVSARKEEAFELRVGRHTPDTVEAFLARSEAVLRQRRCPASCSADLAPSRNGLPLMSSTSTEIFAATRHLLILISVSAAFVGSFLRSTAQMRSAK